MVTEQLDVILEFSVRTWFKKTYQSSSLPSCRIFVRGQNKIEEKAEGVASDWLQILRIRLGKLSNPLHLLGFKLFKA